jgi:DNA-directed RNA polymerase subunit RPC12/RpoP
MAECIKPYCHTEALGGYSKCKRHLNQNVVYMRNKRAKDRVYYERELEKNQARKDRYESEYRCRRCSKPLAEDTDKNFKECLNCRERIDYA